MQKLILDKDQLHDLVINNRYKVNPEKKFFSRCIDGRYKNSKDLEALAYPGADAGELALILATANEYCVEADENSAYQTLAEAVGGEKNLKFHTDSHVEKGKVLAGCGHIKQMTLDPKAYKLEQSQIDFIKTSFENALKKGAKESELHGDHIEGAVVIVKGNYGILPQYELKAEVGIAVVQIFIYHQSLVDERHRVLSKKLIKNKAVKLFDDCDDEYLYEVMSETAESHLMETAKRLAAGLPIYLVEFKDKGGFKIVEMGKV